MDGRTDEVGGGSNCARALQVGDDDDEWTFVGGNPTFIILCSIEADEQEKKRQEMYNVVRVCDTFYNYVFH